MKRPELLCCADLHIRNSVPVYRKDDYFIAQARKLNFIFNLAASHGIPVVVAGDFGDRSRWPYELLIWFLAFYKKNGYGKKIPFTAVVPGQHDLLNNTLDNLERCTLKVLDMVGMGVGVLDNKSLVYDSFPYGFSIKKPQGSNASIAIAHQMVIKETPLWSGQEAPKARNILRNNDYDLIVVGDNHKSFMVEYEGRYLVNPGSMMRMSIDQIDHRPSVYLWSSTEGVERVYLPIDEDVFSETNRVEIKAREGRVTALIEGLKTGYERGISFEQNMANYFQNNRTRSKVKEKVYKCMEGGSNEK